MDDFALNAAPVNGAVSLDIVLDGTIDCALALGGEIRAGTLLDGDTTVALQTSGTASAGLMLAGSADIAFDASAESMRFVPIGGDTIIALDTTHDLTRWALGTATIAIALQPTLDLTRRALGSGTIGIDLIVSGDARLVQRVYLDGECGIVIDPAYLDGRRTQAHRPGLPLDIALDLEGAAWLEMHSAAGTAAIDMVLEGIARIGGKVQIEGACEIELIANGKARQYRQVPIEGVADIEFVLIAERAGRPLIPSEYVPAPTGRRFVVPRQARERRITYERRL
ncbi:hypothetical protein [Bradyrhizobium elkanii]|uniref:hypothetical protein n=1 Tax=Bradyrhizobium elkanii TaxID=29448 RepID=UPI003513E737